MQKKSPLQIGRKLLAAFYLSIACTFLVLLLVLVLSLGIEEIVTLVSIVSVGCAAVFLLSCIPALLILNVLKRLEEKKEDSDLRINSIASRGQLIISTGCGIGVAGIAAAAKVLGVFPMAEQAIFFAVIGLLLSIMDGAFFFYYAKVLLYELREGNNIRPLSIFAELTIPIVAAIIIILTGSAVYLYRANTAQVEELFKEKVISRIDQRTALSASFFADADHQLEVLVKADEFTQGNPAEIASMLRRIHATRAEHIHSYFFLDLEGNSTTSFDTTETNLKDREYYIKALSQDRTVFSEPLLSRRMKIWIVNAAHSVKRNGKNVGVLCVTIAIDRFREELNADSITPSGRFIVIGETGRILLHKNEKLIGLVVGDTLKDDGVNTVGIASLRTEQPGHFFSYKFEGARTLSYKASIPGVSQYLVFSCDREDFLAPIKPVILQLSAGIVGLVILISMLVYSITRNFSGSIQNTVHVLGALSDGDLTAESRDMLSDEFGDLLNHIRTFQHRLRDAIQQSLSAAIQLSSSSEQLAATSQNLARGAQSQAAAVEEASASIEEVSGSGQLINNHALEQEEKARETVKSMTELKVDNQTVVKYAGEALSAAKSSTEQANTGRRLMESTIQGMDTIDESTKKIAEMVDLISDISDQVNLLALNASIEAARAGDHGRGFAVVAQEISKLADQTATSAKSIAELVERGLIEVNKGREYVDSTSAAFNNIIAFVAQTESLVKRITESAEKELGSSDKVLRNTQQVMEMADLITSSTREQVLTNNEMAKAMEQINQNTQASAASAEEIAASAEQINAQAETLRERMRFFKV